MHVSDTLNIPTFAKFVRDIVNNERSWNLKEQVAMITKYPFKDKVAANLVDPGIPTISCSIGNININNALCDIGARVTVMPLALYRRLNLGECIPAGITLQMSHKSTKKPIGVAEDVPLRLDGHIIPID